MRRGLALLGAVGGMASVVSLWLPWFSRTVIVHLPAPGLDGSLTGWEALGGLGVALVASAAVAGLGALRPVPPYALFLAGAVALVVEMIAVVGELGTPASEVIRTTPGAGLLAGVGGAAAMALAGLSALIADVRLRADAARAG